LQEHVDLAQSYGVCSPSVDIFLVFQRCFICLVIGNLMAVGIAGSLHGEEPPCEHSLNDWRELFYMASLPKK